MHHYNNTTDLILPGEIWKDVVGYEGYYKVSNKGRIKSLDKIIDHWRGGTRLIKGRILCQSVKWRYLTVGLCVNRVVVMTRVHREVAKAFIPNPKNYPITNHLDCDPLNNESTNLEWCTISHNTKHAYDNGRIKLSRGSKHHNSKLTNHIVKKIRRLATSKQQTEIATLFKISTTTVSQIINRKRWAWLE